MSYRVGEVCQRTGLTPRQLREWERRGLVDPSRGTGNQRAYSDEDVQKLALAKRLRDSGLALAEVRLVIDVLRGGRLGLEAEALAQIQAAVARMQAHLALVNALAGAVRTGLVGRGTRGTRRP